MFEVDLPPCPECGGDMVGYRVESEAGVAWSCRACGAAFSLRPDGTLQPRLASLDWPLCPDCGTGMLAQPRKAHGTESDLRCPGCGFEFSF